MTWHNVNVCCYSLFSSSGWRSLYNPQLTGDRHISDTKPLPLKMKMTQHWNHSTQLKMNHSIALSDSVRTLNYVWLNLLNILILSCREIISWSHSGDTHIGVFFPGKYYVKWNGCDLLYLMFNNIYRFVITTITRNSHKHISQMQRSMDLCLFEFYNEMAEYLNKILMNWVILIWAWAWLLIKKGFC